jgi:hypothetical protein
VVDPDGTQLVAACLAGDTAARQQFRTQFLPLIYDFELRVAGRGGELESAGGDFLGFVFEGDRIYRRLGGFRGATRLARYLWGWILPDLLKQFRGMLRRQRLDTVSLDANPVYSATIAADDAHSEGDASPGVAALLEGLSMEKRILFKILHPEDFDLDAAEVQFLAARTGRSIRTVLERLDEARRVVREREAVQHARLEDAESSGQWIRLYECRLAQLDEDLQALVADSARAARLREQRATLLQKLDKRRRQQAERLRTGAHTVVTVPTEMVADILGQRPSVTRSQITRARQELAALLADRCGRTVVSRPTKPTAQLQPVEGDADETD